MGIIKKNYQMKSFKHHITEAQTFFRGHAKGANPNKSNRKGITWITPNEKLAATYGDEVSPVKFNPRQHKVANLGEINKSGTVKDILDVVTPKGNKAQKLYDDAVYHFGGGTKRMDLPKFLHKIGSEKVIAYFKSMGITAFLAKEDGVITYGIMK
jgi:hypothetical protein